MGEVCQEIADLKTRRACLTTKIERFKKQIAGADTVLSSLLAHGSPRETPSEGDWPSYADILSVFDETTEVKRRIVELESRLREWKVMD